MARFAPEQKLPYYLKPGRHAWVQAARGSVLLNGISLNAGDGAMVSPEEIPEISAQADSEILLFDLA